MNKSTSQIIGMSEQLYGKNVSPYDKYNDTVSRNHQTSLMSPEQRMIDNLKTEL